MADLPTSPNNREEQYLAFIAGQSVEVPECPWSRKEAYLDAINGRVESLQDEIEALENNPDVADIVDTYADLEAYDTSTLTDKDIIRVLNDETHDGNSTYYRYSTATGEFTYIGTTKQYTDFVGTDGTTAGTAGLVPAPATTDADKFLKSDGTWGEAGGGTKTLTTADYNYPTSDPKRIAFWLMEPGIYTNKTGGNLSWAISNVSSGTLVAGATVIVSPRRGPGVNQNNKIALVFNGQSLQAFVYTNNDGTKGRGELTEESGLGSQDNVVLSSAVKRTTDSSNSGDYYLMTQKAISDALAAKEDLGTTETLTIADTDWSALSSSDPYTYSATVSVTATIGANSTVELLNDQAVLFATYGFAIGAVDAINNTITIYSIGEPDTSVSLTVNIRG